MNANAFLWPLAGACVLAGLDQIVKLLMLATKPDLSVIPGFFSIRFATNTGAAFSLFAGFPNALGLVGLSILVGLLFYLWKRAAIAPPLERVGLSLVIGGALGNLVDRFRLGYVVDYLDVFVRDYHWPTFNLADSAVTVGAACLIAASMRRAEPAESAPISQESP